MTDMRTARTQQYLREALVALLLEKPYKEITVREVAARAQVSKNSFYNHYATLDALVQDCYLQESVYFGPSRRRRADYACRHDACAEVLWDTAKRLVFFKQNPNLARVILTNVCQSPYFAECRHSEEELLLDHLETEYGDTCLPFLSRDNVARYTVWGMYGHIRAWFLAGATRPVEDVAKEEIYCALHNMAGTVGRAIEPEYLQTIEQWRFEDCPCISTGMQAVHTGQAT